MSEDTEQPPEGQIKPEDVLSQFLVVHTKDGRAAVQFPTKADGSIDGIEALRLLSTGLTFVTQILQQQVPAEKPRIVLAPAIPKEFLLKGLRPD